MLADPEIRHELLKQRLFQFVAQTKMIRPVRDGTLPRL